MVPGLRKFLIEYPLQQTVDVNTIERLAVSRYIEQFQDILLDADEKYYIDNMSSIEIAEAQGYFEEELRKLAAEIDGLDNQDQYLANHLCNYAHYYCNRALDDAHANSRNPTAKEFENQKLRKNPLFQNDR